MDGETGFARGGDDGGDGAFGDLFALAQNAASSEEESSDEDGDESGDNAAAADAAPLEPGAARAIQQQVAEAQAQPYRPPIAGAAPLGGGAAVAAALAALAALAAINFAVVAWIGLFVYGFFVAVAIELARHALAVARGWPRMIVDARRCQLATAACAVVLTAYPASLLLLESGLLAPLAVPLGYLGVGFLPMALWMRKAERW